MYRLKLSVFCANAGHTVVEDHKPRPREFWGKQFDYLLKEGFIEEVADEAKEEVVNTDPELEPIPGPEPEKAEEAQEEAKEEVKFKKRGA